MRAVLLLTLLFLLIPQPAGAAEERRGLLMRISAGPGPLFLASNANLIGRFEEPIPSSARAWGITATGEIGGSIGTGWVLSGYARYGAYTGVRARVADLKVDMQNLSVITIGTGASLSFFPDETAGRYLRLHLGFLGLGLEAYAHGENSLLDDLRGPECALAYGHEVRLSGNLWAGFAVDLAAAHLSDEDPHSATLLFTPTVRGTLTFF